EIFLLYTYSNADFGGHMKSSAPLAVAGIVSCILIVGCIQSPQAGVSNPPASSYQVGSFELQDSGGFQKVRGASVTATFFQIAKVMPLLGRSFLPEEYSSGRQQVVLVSQRFWQHQFGGDPRIVGTTMHLNGQSFTVIGVMPTMFDVPSGVDIWLPKAG
ncbi:MAG TPA: ABC transporter permease, partial [Terriglobia bacterium]|nr:ABC transporter permease [Terriglobia bacterium]